MQQVYSYYIIYIYILTILSIWIKYKAALIFSGTAPLISLLESELETKIIKTRIKLTNWEICDIIKLKEV